MATYAISQSELGMVSCATCRRNLIGERTAKRLRMMQKSYWPNMARVTPVVFGRRNERPYCEACYLRAVCES